MLTADEFHDDSVALDFDHEQTAPMASNDARGKRMGCRNTEKFQNFGTALTTHRVDVRMI